MTPEGLRTVTYRLVNGERIVDGDIVLPVADDGVRGAAPAQVARWTDNIVPYEIATDLPNQARVHDAIAHYQRFTSLRLVPRAGDLLYARFVRDGSACSSPIGRPHLTPIPPPNPPQPASNRIKLADTCSTGSTMHEIGHTVGLWHEQSRPDRDLYVTVNFANIDDDHDDNFDKHSLDGAVYAGPYDDGSLMHYGSFAFAIDPAIPTITRNSGNPIIVANRAGLSPVDMRSLASMYPPKVTAAAAICRSAPLHLPSGTPPKQADLAEVWEDVGTRSSIAVHRSSGAGFSLNEGWSARDGAFHADFRWAAGDFNGDKRQDLVAIWPENGFNTLSVRLSNGTGFTVAHWAVQQGPWMATTQWIPGDFDKDGLTDLAAVWDDAGRTSIDVFRSTGTGFAAPQPWVVRDGGWHPTMKWDTGDFNEDQRDDILSVWDDGGLNTFTVRLSTGAGFVPQHWAIQSGGWDHAHQYRTGDFDGNGKTDVLGLWNDGGQVGFAMWYSTGTGFTAPTQWLGGVTNFTPDLRWSVGDVNGDGLDDLLMASNDAGLTTLTVRRSTGATFIAPAQWGPRVAAYQYSASFCAGAFDGI